MFLHKRVQSYTKECALGFVNSPRGRPGCGITQSRARCFAELCTTERRRRQHNKFLSSRNLEAFDFFVFVASPMENAWNAFLPSLLTLTEMYLSQYLPLGQRRIINQSGRQTSQWSYAAGGRRGTGEGRKNEEGKKPDSPLFKKLEFYTAKPRCGGGLHSTRITVS